MDIEEYKNFRNKYLQHPITFLTEENLDKLEDHCRKAINYERGVEHKVVLELLERYKEFLTKIEKDKKRIEELEVLEDDLKDKRIVYVDTPEFEENYIPKQKVLEEIDQVLEAFRKVEFNRVTTWNSLVLLKERLLGGNK